MSDQYWEKKIKLPNTQYTVIGYSVAAYKTCFYVPELKLMLDCGVPNRFVPEHIFITHGHSDHTNHVPLNLVEFGNIKTTIDKMPVIYVPKLIEDNMKNYIHSFYVLSKNNPNHIMHTKYKLFGVIDDTYFEAKINGRDWLIDVIKCHHTVPCVGYGFTEIRQKLKDKYKGLSGDELKKLKNQDVEIVDYVNFPIFCYIGDTTIKVFENKIIDKYNIIFVECTFLSKEHMSLSEEKGHIAWDNLEPIIKEKSDKTFILYHFSGRYNKEEILSFFSKIELKNVIVWA